MGELSIHTTAKDLTKWESAKYLCNPYKTQIRWPAWMVTVYLSVHY